MPPIVLEAAWASISLAVVSTLLLEPSRAVAQTRPSATFVYVRPPGLEACPDEEAVRNAVASRLGYYPFDVHASRAVVARITSDDRGLRAEVTLQTEGGHVTGSRQLATPTGDCGELSSAMELAISIAIDPLVMTKPTPPPKIDPPRMVPPTPVLSPPPPPPPPDRSVPRKRPTLQAGVGTHAAFASAPATAFGLTAEVGLRWPLASMAVEGRVDLPASRTTSAGGVRSSLLLASAVPCAHYRLGLACALVSIGALQGAGIDVGRPRQDTTLYLAAGVRLGAEIPLGGFLSGRLHVDLLGTPTRTALRIDDRDVWTTPPVSATLGLGLAGNFP